VVVEVEEGWGEGADRISSIKEEIGEGGDMSGEEMGRKESGGGVGGGMGGEGGGDVCGVGGEMIKMVVGSDVGGGLILLFRDGHRLRGGGGGEGVNDGVGPHLPILGGH
jgi:hypothetical protein